ncbi:MAG: ABC transporter ATP-binding protein [Bryobacterales bacterium]|nr:ABC transporter ATP-binding protein [Bryobacterales bacterium]
MQALGLRYQYADGTEALRGVDVHLSPRENLFIFGPNGSGKTSLLLRLCGLLEGPGDILLDGTPVSPKAPGTLRRRVGVVFQDADDQLFMPTVMEDVTYGLLNLGKTTDEAIRLAEQALRLVNALELREKAPYHLSGGEKRRVALAGVLAMKPEILILDEPTTSLDPPGQRELLRILAGLDQAKIITTHDTHFAQALGGRALFLEHGLVAGEGTVRDIVRQFSWEVGPAFARDGQSDN